MTASDDGFLADGRPEVMEAYVAIAGSTVYVCSCRSSSS